LAPLATKAPAGLLAALLVVRFADEWGAFLPAGTFDAFRHDLGLTYAQAGAVLAAAAPGAIVGNAFTLAADYVSRRALAAGGAAGYACALAAFGFGHSFPMLLAASFVYGMAATAMVDSTELALVDVAGDDLEPLLATSNLLGAVGDLAGPVTILVASALGFGWRGPFVAAAVLMLAYAVWLACLPLPPPAPHEHRERPARALRSVARDRRVWFYAAVGVLMGPLDEPFLGFLIAFAREHRGFSETGAVSIALSSIAGSVAGFALLSGRAHTTSLTRAATTMAVAAVVLVLAPWPVVMVPAAFAFGVGMAALWNEVQVRVLRLRPGQTGAVTAVVSTVEFAAFGLPIAFGAVADAAGVAAGLGCYAVTAITLALLVTRAPAAQASSERAI
jgi:predicted MFS family arabinose efflux permease